MDFSGTGVAIVTPFKANNTIDFTSLERLIEHLIGGGVDYLVALGTTSEAAAMSEDERLAVLNFVIEINKGRVPLVRGCGGNNTQAVINELRSMSTEGIDGILSVSPYYNKPQQKGIYQHFRHVAEATSLPIIIYNVPSRTSSNISAETTLKLAHDIENIVAVKEASGDLVQCMEIIQNKPDGFRVLSGDDALSLPFLASGGDGVISVVANAYPDRFSGMVKAAREGYLPHAKELHYQLINLINLLFIDGNPSGIKAALEHLGVVENNLRLPLVKVNKAVNNAIKQQIDLIG